MYEWWFETQRFTAEASLESSAVEPAANPGRYGQQLATWLAGELATRGWDDPRVFCEDWGWCISCERDGVRMAVHCGNEDGSTTRWLVACRAWAGFFERLFGGAALQRAVDQLDAAVESALRSDPAISYISREQPMRDD